MNGKKLVYLALRLASAILGLVILLYGVFRIGSLERRLVRMEGSGEIRLDEVGRELKDIREQILIVISKLKTQEDGLFEEAGAEPQVRFATLAEAEALTKKLGEKPSASDLAQAIATMDD